MTRFGAGAKFRLVAGFDRDPRSYQRVFPFRRHWPAIAVVAVFDAVFTWPAVTTLQQVVAGWRSLDGLHELVSTLFLSAWLMGWSMAPLALTTVLLLMLLGQERIRVTPERFEHFIGLPFFGLAGISDPARLRNLRQVTPKPKSGTSWRGTHLAADFGSRSIAFGSDLSTADAARLIHEIESAAGRRIRRGEATEEELAAERSAPGGASSLLGAIAGVAARPAEEPLSGQGSADEAPPGRGDAPARSRPDLFSLSALLLITANLIPVAGALFLGWKLSDVMVLYWAESAIIGFYNVLKIAVIGRWLALLAGPFFVGHFGGFMAVHFLFIYTIFVQGDPSGATDDLGAVWALFRDLAPALLALLASHGVSFTQNFLGRREYVTRTVNDQMSEPYSRILFMHLVIIFGGGLALILGEPKPVILIVIALKIAMDLRAHRKEHSEGP